MKCCCPTIELDSPHEDGGKRGERVPHTRALCDERPLLQRTRLQRDIPRQVQGGPPPQVVSQARRGAVPEASPRDLLSPLRLDGAVRVLWGNMDCPVSKGVINCGDGGDGADFDPLDVTTNCESVAGPY